MDTTNNRSGSDVIAISTPTEMARRFKFVRAFKIGGVLIALVAISVALLVVYLLHNPLSGFPGPTPG